MADAADVGSRPPGTIAENPGSLPPRAHPCAAFGGMPRNRQTFVRGGTRTCR
eukprot:CAMPEP_0171174562 /NCGR_PEP_ID=MMETSP0790-20130122/10790_1 /TAXON_ID=2925 /ORGANISM="Alexandrium catenella, Strain OF101" /LENGTH=51 /DNA_ID=CAMNT_0011639437 /DNA_START=90 /DNA_END=241 /DNA_ORIENTATION=+